MAMRILMAWGVLVLGCGSGKDEPGRDAAADADSDTDIDSDADTDSDTDTTSCDQDGDRHLAPECGGDDCDDTNWDVHPGVSEDEDWTVEWILADRNDLYGADMALDADDVQHIAFNWRASGGDPHLNELRYATDAGRDWAFEIVEPGAYSDDISIATSSDGVPHIVYGHAAELGLPAELRHATLQGAEWTVETVEGLGGAITPFGASVVVASDGVVHMTYSSGPMGNRMLRHAASGPDGLGPFVTEAVDVGADAALSSLAVAPDGALDVFYYSFRVRALHHASDAGGGWDLEVVDADGDAGRDSAVAVDADGALHVIYRTDAGYDTELRHATNARGRWEVETIEIVYVSGIAMALDPRPERAGVVHVAYRALAERQLRYATNQSGVWASEVAVDRPPDNGAMAIAVGTDDVIRVVFLLADANDLGLAYTEPGNGIDDDCNGIAR